MRKKILGLAVFLSLALFVSAQPQPRLIWEGIAAKNTLLSVNFGVGSFIGNSVPSIAFDEFDNDYYGLSVPMENWFDSKPILTVEGRMFITPKWSVKATGGFAYNYNPAHEGRMAISDDEFPIPEYKAVPQSENLQFSIKFGGDYHKQIADRLYARAGLEAGFAYGRAISIKKETVNPETDEISFKAKAVGEAYAFVIAPVVGADYFIANNLFVGFEIRPMSYQYSVYKLRPMSSVKMLKADGHSFSFLSQPMIKLGIKF